MDMSSSTSKMKRYNCENDCRGNTSLRPVKTVRRAVKIESDVRRVVEIWFLSWLQCYSLYSLLSWASLIVMPFTCFHLEKLSVRTTWYAFGPGNNVGSYERIQRIPVGWVWKKMEMVSDWERLLMNQALDYSIGKFAFVVPDTYRIMQNCTAHSAQGKTKASLVIISRGICVMMVMLLGVACREALNSESYSLDTLLRTAS